MIHRRAAKLGETRPAPGWPDRRVRGDPCAVSSHPPALPCVADSAVPPGTVMPGCRAAHLRARVPASLLQRPARQSRRSRHCRQTSIRVAKAESIGIARLARDGQPTRGCGGSTARCVQSRAAPVRAWTGPEPSIFPCQGRAGVACRASPPRMRAVWAGRCSLQAPLPLRCSACGSDGTGSLRSRTTAALRAFRSRLCPA